MQSVDAQPTLTYLPTATYDDLVKRANLADVTMEQIKLLREENMALKERITNHSARIVALEIDLDKLLSKDPGKTDTLRVQKLIKYMKDRPDRKASFATLRGVLQVDAPKLRAVIKAADMLDPGRFEVRDDERDRRKSWLFAKR